MRVEDLIPSPPSQVYWANKTWLTKGLSQNLVKEVVFLHTLQLAENRPNFVTTTRQQVDILQKLTDTSFQQEVW